MDNTKYTVFIREDNDCETIPVIFIFKNKLNSVYDFQAIKEDAYWYVNHMEDWNKEESDKLFHSTFGGELTYEDFPYEKRMKYANNYLEFMRKCIEISHGIDIENIFELYDTEAINNFIKNNMK